jgi:hypothetical protein
LGVASKRRNILNNIEECVCVCVFFLENSTADLTEKPFGSTQVKPNGRRHDWTFPCSLISLNLGLLWYQTGALSLSHQPSRQQFREVFLITHNCRVLKIFKEPAGFPQKEPTVQGRLFD